MKTKFDLNQWIRKEVIALQPYSSARDEFDGEKEQMVFLDANENPFDNGLNRYPDPQQTEIKTLLAKQKNVQPNQILIGNGSDEVLDLIFRVFCQPNQDEVLLLPPTYGMYNVLANIHGIEIRNAALTTDFQIDITSILKATSSKTKVLFLCSPNNPSSNSFCVDLLEELLTQFNGLVVLDEAYIDFSTQESFLTKLNLYPNLIITQTLSKAYGLAGIRIGIGYASASIIELLNRVKLPYNINTLTQRKVLEELLNTEKVDSQIELILSERKRLVSFLLKLPLVQHVFPSDTNFLLIRVDDATKRYTQLIEKGIVVRNRNKELHCENCLRITVGTPQENDYLMTQLTKL